MREKFLIDLQFKFLKSLGFCFVENYVWLLIMVANLYVSK